MTIARIMENRSGEIISARSDESVRAVVARLAEHRIGAVPVLDDEGAVLGIFSERDLVYCIAAKGDAAFDLRVAEAMTAPAVSATSDTGALAALSLMSKRRIRHLPVIEGGSMVAFVSIGDLVKYRIDKIEAEAEGMRQYIQAV
ncbi:MAG: CBS domain-containing protein [Sphingomonadales bacterium]|nr:CBS domain-containing protein [Sphingomonadales bacterium]